MNYLKRICIFIIIIFPLYGCGVKNNFSRSEVYKNAANYNKQLIIPSDINANIVGNEYPVPKVPVNNKSVNVSTLPPGSNISD